jgi:putative inorganic carbon (HCO3(-)) transporter
MTPLRTLEMSSVAAAAFLSAAAFLPAAADPVNPIKLTVVLMGSLVALGAAAAASIRERTVHVPVGPWTIVLIALVLALAAAAVVSPSSTTALMGTPGRLSGLLLYAPCAALAVSTLRGGLGGLPFVEAGVGAAGVFTASYGLLQYAGVDAVAWANEFNPIIAALGNPNFASAYMGIAAPLLMAWALRADEPRTLRITTGVTAGLLLLAATLSGAVQGPLAAAAGAVVVATAWFLNSPQPRMWQGLTGLGVLAGSGFIALLLGAAGTGPAVRIFGAGNFQTRQWYWSAALDMWQQSPLLGVGLDHYGRFWRTSRPLDNVRTLGGGDFTDAAHNVPLHLLATGGLVVAVAYLAFVLMTAWALVHGLRQLEGSARLRLAGLGGAWVAYQVQSLVSIDQVPLVVLNFVLAAAVVVASGTGRLHSLRLPGALPPPQAPAPGRRRAASTAARVRATTPADVALLSVTGLVGLVLLWLALIPLRADLAVQDGDQALRRGDGNASLAAYDRAIALLPGRTTAWARKGGLLTNVRPAVALQAYDGAIAADPSNIGALRAAADLAEAQGELERARAYHAQAVRRDPYNPTTVTAAATFELRHGGADQALELLEQAVARTPEQAALWTPLGDARQVLGDEEGAVEAYERALSLDPTIAKAIEELAKLRG